MMTTRLRDSDKLNWLLRVIAFAIMTAPVVVNGQTITAALIWQQMASEGAHQLALQEAATSQPPLTIPDISGVPEGVAPFDAVDPTYGGPQIIESAPVVAAPVSAPTPCYWIASSRGLPQQPAQSRCRMLEYFHRLPNGCLQRTSLPTLASQMIPGVPVCIFIHGAFVDAESHRYESARTYNWIRRAAPHLPIQVIFYTWPSDADCMMASPLLVNQRGRWAENNAFFLADLIAQLPHECPVCLVGHSHGSRLAVSTMHLLGGGQVAGYTYPYNTGCHRRYRTVLAAAAFDRHWLNPGQKYDRALLRTEGMLNLQNRGDWALNMYPLRRPFSRKALGATGFTRWDRSRLGHQSCKAIDLDVTTFVGLDHTWPNYYEQPAIARAIVPYVYFADHR